ncbi:hypothetical protein ACWD4G_20490 [Streptomyces sp. NPDC002643]
MAEALHAYGDYVPYRVKNRDTGDSPHCASPSGSRPGRPSSSGAMA